MRRRGAGRRGIRGAPDQAGNTRVALAALRKGGTAALSLVPTIALLDQPRSPVDPR